MNIESIEYYILHALPHRIGGCKNRKSKSSTRESSSEVVENHDLTIIIIFNIYKYY